MSNEEKILLLDKLWPTIRTVFGQVEATILPSGGVAVFDESNRTDADRQRLMRIFRHSVKQKTGLEITISVIKRQSFKAA